MYVASPFRPISTVGGTVRGDTNTTRARVSSSTMVTSASVTLSEAVVVPETVTVFVSTGPSTSSSSGVSVIRAVARTAPAGMVSVASTRTWKSVDVAAASITTVAVVVAAPSSSAVTVSGVAPASSRTVRGDTASVTFVDAASSSFTVTSTGGTVTPASP